MEASKFLQNTKLTRKIRSQCIKKLYPPNITSMINVRNFSKLQYDLDTKPVFRSQYKNNKLQQIHDRSGFKDKFHDYDDNARDIEVINTCNIDNIVETVSNMFGANQFSYGQAIKRCHYAGRFDLIHEIMLKAIDKGIIKDQKIFGLYFNAMGDFDKLWECKDMFKIMRNKYQMIPNERIYGILISQLCKYELTPSKVLFAEQLFEEMGTLNIEWNNYLYSTVISFFAKARMREQAKAAFDRWLNDDGCDKKDTFIWSAYLRSFIKDGDIVGMNEVAKLMKKYDAKPDEFVYSALMNGFICADEPKRAIALFKKIASEGCKIDRKCLNNKYFAYSMLQRKCDDNGEDMTKYFNIIQNQCIEEHKKYNQKIDYSTDMLILDSLVLYYRKTDPKKIFDTIEKYAEMYPFIRDNCIAVTSYKGRVLKEFIFRYILAYKLNDPKFINKDVRIISRDYHTFINDLDKHNIKYTQDVINRDFQIISANEMDKIRENNPFIQYFEGPNNDWINTKNSSIEFED